MRKIFPALILSVLCISCVVEKKSNYTIGVSQCSLDSWRENANRDILREASFFNDLQVEIRSVADNSEDQIADIRYFMDKGVDLIIISPNESEALTPVVSEAYLSGIPIILHDRKIGNENYTAYVGADNRQIGSEIGEYLNKNFARSKEIRLLIVRGTAGSTADEERYEGLMSSLRENGGPDRWIVVSEFNGNFSRGEAHERTAEWLSREEGSGPIDAVVAFNDRMAMGVHDAFSEAGRGLPEIFGVDALFADGEGVDAILNGIITASFMYPVGGEQLVDVARRILNDVSFSRINTLNTAAVDRTNARVLKLQHKQLNKEQEKLDAMNQQFQHYSLLYAGQHRVLLLMISLLVLGIFLICLLIAFNRKQKQFNQRINERNATIERQVVELSDQKKQLETLTSNLEESTQAKLSFYTNVSHEFKTPLTLIAGNLEELLSDPSLDFRTRETLQVINRNSHKLLSLVNEILDFRTIESGKMEIHNEPGDLKHFIENINILFRDLFRRRRIEFLFDAPEEDWKMMADWNKLEKIYFNLLSNALKNVSPAGTITVKLKLFSSSVQPLFELSVYNSGSYIPPEKTLDIFQPFYKMAPDDTGTGIGLPLTASLITVMGGEIRVESNPSTGTEFIVDLPLLPIGETPETEKKKVEDTYTHQHLVSEKGPATTQDEILDETDNAGKATVLVIEDNADMLQYIKRLLCTDYRVLLASDGEKGIEKAHQFLPDLILCDIMMPGIDGYEVCRRLKQNRKTNHIPIIILTACSLDKQQAAGYESGADAYLQKPFNAEILRIRIQKLIEQHETIRENFGNDWLLGRKTGSSNESAVLVGKLKEYVEQHLEKEIGVEEIARYLGLSKSTLYRKLREITDWSPLDLIRLIRLRHAINLMLYEGKYITEAAYESGFNSPSYFSRTFQKYYGQTAREFLKQHS